MDTRSSNARQAVLLTLLLTLRDVAELKYLTGVITGRLAKPDLTQE